MQSLEKGQPAFRKLAWRRSAPCGQWFLYILFTAASRVPDTEAFNKNLLNTRMGQDFKDQRLFDWTTVHYFSSFLSGGQQDLSCPRRIQAGRADKPRTVKMEGMVWGNKQRRERTKDVLSWLRQSWWRFVLRISGVSIRNRDQGMMAEGLVHWAKGMCIC